MATTDVRGIDAANVTAWMAERLPALAPPLHFELIAGGHSNLTFRVIDDDGTSWVLRRPPLYQVLATAHDMTREHKVISALQGSAVPVPGVVGLCTDESVNDRPFYVMEFVDGLVVRDFAIAETLSTEQKVRASESLVDVMVALHSVDVDAVGLTDLGRKQDYIARQLKRWMGQFDDSKTTERPAVREIHDFLAAHIPEQQGVGIVHGDYRLDNCMIDEVGNVNAVLDWEICTLGDVLADLAQLIIYWNEPGDTRTSLSNTPTQSHGFFTREQMRARYAAASDRDLEHWDFYVAFAYWKLACIIEGVYSRYVNGAMGDKVPEGGFEPFVLQIEGLIESASEAVARVR